MSNCFLLSDKPLEGYQAFLGEAIKELNGKPVKGVALVAILDDGYALCGYHDLDLAGKQLAAAQIQADITDAIVRANIRSYLDEMEEDEEECEE